MITFAEEVLKAIHHENTKVLVKIIYSIIFLGVPLLKILNWISDLDKKTLELKLKQIELKHKEIELELKEIELKNKKNETTET